MEAINSASSERRNIIGVEISNLTPAQQTALNFNGGGVYVSAVIPGHPAAVAGMLVGDIITKIGDWEVVDDPLNAVSSALENMDTLKPGQKNLIKVHRRLVNGASQELTLNVLVEEVQERAIGKIS
ncbi:MAG: PDZ domain-containing protein [Candidatus Paracaedibacter sp.]